MLPNNRTLSPLSLALCAGISLATSSAARAADQRLAGAPWRAASASGADRALAAAHADRAVLRWLSGDPRGARADLARAQGLAPQAGFVVNDLSALRSHPPEELASGS
jgi:hypothetical protein